MKKQAAGPSLEPPDVSPVPSRQLTVLIGMRSVLRLFTASFALWPLLVYLAWLTPAEPRLLDAVTGFLFTLVLVVLPALFRLRGWASALYYLVLNLLTVIALLNLALTMELPSLGASSVALRTTWDEAAAMLVAAKGAATALLAVTAIWLVGCASFLREPPDFPAKLASLPLRLTLATPLLVALAVPNAATIYPMSLAAIAAGLTEYGVDSKHGNRRLVDPFQVSRDAAAPQVVVLVIGESSGAKHWQLNGYARATTPFMARRLQSRQIVNFPAHMSTAGMTSYAVPSLLSPFGEMNGIGSPPHRRSLVTLLSRAGYRTAWYGANTPQPAGTEADEIVYSSDDAMLGVDMTYDDWLPLYMGKWLDRVSSGSAFIVLHTWGNHTPFEARYPPASAVWKDHIGKPYPKSQTIDNYDNSILFTDTVLEAAISRLEQDRRPAVLVFIADHAEPWMQRSLWRYLAPRDENLLHVPFLMWASESWRQAHASKWKALEDFARSGSTTTHLNVVPTLAGVLGISYEGKPSNMDVLSGDFQPWTTTPALGSDDKTVVQAVPPRVASAPARAAQPSAAASP